MKDLRNIMKNNGITGGSFMLKQEMIDVLTQKGLIPKQEPEIKQPCNQKSKSRDTRNNPRQVNVENIETGEIVSYPSVYSAGKALHMGPSSVLFFHGKIARGKPKYKITVCQPRSYALKET